MSRKPQQTRLFRKFEEEDVKAYKDKPAAKTDRLVEESINSDLSFSKEDSFSIANLKQDWDSIKLLQEDIKKTSEKLKKLSNPQIRPSSECAKPLKADKKSKIDHSQAKELRRFKEKCDELTLIIAKYEKEK